MTKGRSASLEWWTKLFSLLAIVGIVLVLAGRIAKVKALVLAGLCLGAPLLVLGCLLLVVGIPYVLLGGRRERQDK